VVDALECAVAIQLAMGKRNAAKPEDRRIVFRIGMSLLGHSRPMPRLLPTIDVRFAPKATEVLRCREMTRWAKLGSGVR
jgi:hypothetical protein